jgi:hypothetical protein
LFNNLVSQTTEKGGTIILGTTIQTLVSVVKRIPVGTNLGLVHLMWSMLQGSFLGSRGAIFPALQLSGFNEAETRRAWSAFCYGQWSMVRLLKAWRGHVIAEEKWQGHEYEGYKAVAVDLTSFYRPQLKGFVAKAFNGLLSKAVKGIAFGLVADVGSVAEQRLALPRCLLYGLNETKSEKNSRPNCSVACRSILKLRTSHSLMQALS